MGFMSFGDNDSEISIDHVLEGETTASIIYPFVQGEYETVDMSARVQILEDHPTSPNLEIITRFINENIFANFTTQLMILIQWTFDNVSTMLLKCWLSCLFIITIGLFSSKCNCN